MTPGQYHYWFLPGWVLLLSLAAVASALFVHRAWALYQFLLVGGPDYRLDEPWRRLQRFSRQVLGQGRLFRDVRAGLMHATIFWGFLVITLGTVEIVGQGLFDGFEVPIAGGQGWFRLTLEICQLAVVVAIVYALYRRLYSRPGRLDLSGEALVILLLILGLMVTNFLSAAFRLVQDPTVSVQWAPIAGALAHAFRASGLGPVDATAPYALVWWLHVAILFGFLVFIPYSKHLHIVTAPFNVYFASNAPAGYLVPVDFETSEEFGAAKIEDLSWKHLLDTYTCTECGRCDAVCPAVATGKELHPRSIILNLQHHLIKEAGPTLIGGGSGSTAIAATAAPLRSLLGDVISEQALWECTTCRACMQECPVFIEHVPKIVDMRRALVMMESRFPAELNDPFRGLEVTGNPWQYANETRADWAVAADVPVFEGAIPADVEYLFWVGCYGSFDARNKKVSGAVAALLQRAGVSFGILGRREKCTGDPARRAGNEYLYQMLAEENVETMNTLGVKKIVTACPHCFNTLKNEYPDFGGKYEVVHHTEVIAGLVADGRLQLDRPVEQTVTYHDPCYLGRYNGVYDPPRFILEQIQGIELIEMARSRDRSFCCGAGGARGFMEEPPGQRVNEHRVAQAESTGAGTLAVSCPFCMNMFQDGIQSRVAGDHLRGEDVAEIAERASRAGDVVKSGGAPS